MANKRFIKTFEEGTTFIATEIFVDTVTGVNYIFHRNGQAGGMTVLLDENGKPVVTPKETL